MAINASTLQSLVSISQFSKGQATKVFDRLRDESQLIVLKNNVPAAVLLSPAEFTRLAGIEEDYRLLMLAQERLAGGNLKNAVTEDEAMAALGISEDEICAAEDVEIE
ncbi:MAG: type II toxin-antitoxin system Phd/YefM family antitoxin [Clostridia bacterium]|nr:type II toxin-antitoxin system Phd/YefM family antitoxin [Clostridia bacterium]